MTIEEINHEISLLEPAEVNSRNVQVLSSLYIIRNNLSIDYASTMYNMPMLSGTDISNALSGKPVDKVVGVINELMNVLQAVSPKLYDATIDKLKEL